MQVKGGPDDPIYEDDIIKLDTVVLTPSNKSSINLFFYIPPPSIEFSFGRDVLGYNYDKYHLLYQDPSWHAGYKKMSDAKREGEMFVVGLFGTAIALPYAVTYGSIIIETKFSSYVIQTVGKTGIDATAQYLITGDVNWLNAAAGSVLPGKVGLFGSPILSEGVDVIQNGVSNFDYQKSMLKVGAGYMGSLSGFGAEAVSSGWSSQIGSFIFSNGVQSFQTQGVSEIIDSKFD